MQIPFITQQAKAKRSGIAVIEMVTGLLLIAMVTSVAAYATAQIMMLRRAMYQRTLARESVANLLEHVDGWSFFETTAERAAQLQLDDLTLAMLPGAKLIVTVQENNPAESTRQRDEDSAESERAVAARRVVAELQWGSHPHRLRAALWKWKPAKSPSES